MNIKELFSKAYISVKCINKKPDKFVDLFFSHSDTIFSNDLTFKKVGAVVDQSLFEHNPGIFVSLGEEKKSNLDSFRKAGASFARWCNSHNFNEIYLDIDQPSLVLDKGKIRAVLEGLFIGGFEFDRYKTQNKNKRAVTNILIPSEANFPYLEEEISRAQIIGESVDLARDWIHEPANKINPQSLEERIQTVCEHFGLSSFVLDYESLIAAGAGGLTAVGRGSASKPRLIIVKYKGNETNNPIALVGKAITFDTGGYSLKGSDFIQGMKYDKAGGISVFACILAASRLKLPVNLVAVIPTAENMISGDAYRPDDILTLLNGMTVEIASTDAEGRLILIDALTYAQNQFAPRTIIDIATLTGGVKIALGTLRAGLLSNSDNLADIVYKAGEKTGEKVWRLPMDDDYFDIIKSDDADMKNSGPREASTIVGGIFLKQAISDTTPWAHLDIAATGEAASEKPWCGKGPTGFGIRLMLETIENLI